MTGCEAVAKAMSWKVARCRHVQISELLSSDECDQGVVDFLVANEVGKFPLKSTKGWSWHRA